MEKPIRSEQIAKFKQRYQDIWGREPAGIIRPEEFTPEEQCAILCDNTNIERCDKVCPLAIVSIVHFKSN